jgi:hypothetical protein
VSLTIFAFGLWVFVVGVLGVGWFLTDARMLRRYEGVTGRAISHGSRLAQFARNPLLAIKSLPAGLAAVGEARGTPSADPTLEALRKQSSRLFIATILVGLGGLPLSFATVGVLARLDRFMSLSAWMHALIIGVWLALTIAIVRQPDRSRLAVLFAVAGLGVSILFAGVAVLDRGL